MSQPTLDELLVEAKKAIASAQDLFSIDQLRSQYLGKKSSLTDFLKTLGALPKEERPVFGQKINVAKTEIEDALEKKKRDLNEQAVAISLAKEKCDVTLPGVGEKRGHLHPITKMRFLIEDFFTRLGFSIAEGPEIEDDYHNFTALNFPPDHPARAMQDTFYFPHGFLLRTHTSPVQIRVLESEKPPVRIIAPGRVYRSDSDATHAPMFNQVEGLVIDEKINFAELKWLLGEFVKNIFGEDIKFRLRASYFPFTEPSAELDILWKTADGSERWLEVLGCGMVHPNVLRAVKVDPEKYSGFAFGMGIDRLAMLYYDIPDLRLFFENDLKFLEQF